MEDRARREMLEPFLLALHRTVEADDFWIALQNLLDAALPNQSIVAAVRASGDSPPVFYHTHHRPHHTHAWFTRTLTAHPCYAHLMAHPGLPVLRLSEVLPEGILEAHPFFREFMEPEGWHHGLAFVYWENGRVGSLIPVNRSRDQPDFSDEEVRLAEWLHPRIEAALHRIKHLHPIAEANSSMVAYLSDLPLPVLRLGWDLRLIHANRAARQLLGMWRNPPPSKVAHSGSRRACIPREIRDACAVIRQGILESNPIHWPPSNLPPAVRLVHPSCGQLTAMIRATHGSRRPLSNPSFWIHLDHRDTSVGSPCNLAAVNLLSPAERAVADLLMLGLTNDEIASRLGRSLSTIKAQLQAAYRKLGVHNRAGLIAAIHDKT